MLIIISLQPQGWSQCIPAMQSCNISLQFWLLSFLHKAAQVVILHTKYTWSLKPFMACHSSHLQGKDQMPWYVLSSKTLHELTFAPSLVLTVASKHHTVVSSSLLKGPKEQGLCLLCSPLLPQSENSAWYLLDESMDLRCYILRTMSLACLYYVTVHLPSVYAHFQLKGI